jgi:predicted AAA+ superfamily ATPase
MPKGAFLVEDAQRYNVKGRAYISTPFKYCFTDLGVRNSVLNFRQREENHLMENAINIELIARGYSVDAGVVDTTVTNARGKRERARLEVDLVCNLADKRYYAQSAYSITDPEKANQGARPLRKLEGSFKKIIVESSDSRPWHDDDGILHLGLWDFLLNVDSSDW